MTSVPLQDMIDHYVWRMVKMNSRHSRACVLTGERLWWTAYAGRLKKQSPAHLPPQLYINRAGVAQLTMMGLPPPKKLGY